MKAQELFERATAERPHAEGEPARARSRRTTTEPASDAVLERALDAGVERVEPLERQRLEAHTVDELQALAKEAGVDGRSDMDKAALVDALCELRPAAV